MKTTQFLQLGAAPRRSLVAAGLLALTCLQASATTFTNDTAIGPGNTNYDGLDIVVTNCTLTVDGPHAFSSLLLAPGGVLTHSFYPTGPVTNLLSVTNESQLLNGTNPVTLLNSNVIESSVIVSDSSGTTIYTNDVDYSLFSPDGIVTELERTPNSSIPDGATVLVSYEAILSVTLAGLNLAVTGDVDVAVGGSINVDGRGYGGGVGPGAGHSTSYPQEGSGGGYGGNGGQSSSNAVGGATYGPFTQPAYPGSGGGAGYEGAGGAGGGLIQISVGGSLIIEGLVSANGLNGTNNRSGGGSGGGIWFSAHTIAGSGVIRANGGNGEPIHGGGGGGGRIGLQYALSSFTGLMTAYGGAGAQNGGAGTVYTVLTGQHGLMLADNGGQAGANTPVSLANFSTDVLIRGNASVAPLGNWNFGNLTVASNSLLLATALSPMSLSAAGAINIEAGGGVVADGAGYLQGQGQGEGRGYNDGVYRPCGGGGYGGTGASGMQSNNAAGGIAYGSQSSPTLLGSGGGMLLPYSIGGNGGGAIQISSQGGLVQVDGRLSANGNNGLGSGGGGGSGGSIWITGGTLLGAGSISANGGKGVDGIGGGGGGGRIVIAPAVNQFSGMISAFGGAGRSFGGAGTVLIQGAAQNGQLILDNGGHLGTNTPVQSASSTDLIVRGGAIGAASSSVSFANLWLYSNGWLAPFNSAYNLPATTLTFMFSGNATIMAGAGIIADLAGYPGGQGPGEGRSYYFGATNICSGGGHGGYGGASLANLASGGTTYDSISAPNSPGSGGGMYLATSLGGAGGGVIRLTVSGALEVDGLISANGGNGLGFAGGGGSGGSLWLNVGTLSGVGTIAAAGGNGVDGLGGGGGGGLIYIPCGNNVFSGTITASGGSGANAGGAGPILIQASQKNSLLILDNGGLAGPGLSLSSANPTSSTDLSLRNGAVAFASGGLNLGNVLVGSNSWIAFSNAVPSVSSVNCLSLNIQAGGALLANATGYGPGAGPSAGGYYSGSTNYPCGGGGHGGFGGPSLDDFAFGGRAFYDSSMSPFSPGSGGGSFIPNSVGGVGGGVIRMTVTGTLEIDGVISANGGHGSGLGGGGGAGGAINMTSGALSGVGSITANGGNGAGAVGGGGGGGYIALILTQNLFTGNISAYGGGGANWGGAGTIFIQVNGQSPQLLLDNGNQAGAGTPLVYSSPATMLTVRNGAVGFPFSGSFTYVNLMIGSNAWLTANPVSSPNNPGTVNFTITGNAIIQAGGGISTDRAGSGSGLGQGAGHYSGYPYSASGAGYGGDGASGSTGFVLGGPSYGSSLQPASLGSGGGGYSPDSFGGSGGGSVRLSVTGVLDAQGTISANGGNGSGLGGGGGSGGSVWLTLGALTGAGAISANGGNGADASGGGGGGGRISISLNNNSFTGPVTAYGGGGANWGGAGTVYLRTNSQPDGLLIIDNGGHAGTNTTFDAMTSDLLITGAAIGQLPSNFTMRNLQIRTNSVLTTVASSADQTLFVTGNATIDAGGALSADGNGWAGGFGNGAGVHSSSTGLSGGGGHGGLGAANPPIYGVAYGSVQTPTEPGSGGGSGSSGAQSGGSGGGALHLQVTGTLAVNGRLSAAGIGGAASSGGGSGGSLWVSTGTLAGSGIISANGGSGNGLGGGGGGGGRISISYSANDFSGAITAFGGSGYARGGAGTIYTKANNQSVGQVLVDNGGTAGTNTPLSSAFGLPSQPFNLTVQNGAAVGPQGSFPVLNNLTIANGGLLTSLSAQSILDLTVLNNLDVTTGGAIAVDGLGFSQATGPGAGLSANNDGSGAGYGGLGGASATAPGGPAYGSAQQPVDFGSGGGLGWFQPVGGSEGGGALRLSVGGLLTVDGLVSAEGHPASQDSAGGGSGGSVWVTAGTLAGAGRFAADGGAGDLYGGGGGGAGGRIALYSPANFFLGQSSVVGGSGDFAGASGTVFVSNNVAPLQVVSSSPSGIVSNGVSSVDLFFNAAPNPSSVNSSAVSLSTPAGPLSASSLQVSRLSSAHYQVTFPLQTAVGTYVLTVGTNISDLYGGALAQPYVGTFTILLPVIQGTIADTNGQPVPGVLLQAGGGVSSTTTDTNGNYALGFVPGSSFTVTPSLGTWAFVPSSMSYTNATGSVSNQNYLALSSLATVVTASRAGTSLALSWPAIPGVTYQVYSSTNLTDWAPFGNALTGSNLVQVLVPTDADPMRWFRVGSSD